jgi:hypothetical protein
MSSAEPPPMPGEPSPGMWPDLPAPETDRQGDRESVAFWAGVEQGRREAQRLEGRRRIYARVRAGFAAIGIFAVFWFLSELATRHDAPRPTALPDREALTLLYLGNGKDEGRIDDMRDRITRYARALGWEDEGLLHDEATSRPDPE